jgi:TonB family protein
MSESKTDPVPFVPPPRKGLNREVLRGIALPPEAPKLAEVRPVPVEPSKLTPALSPTHKELDKLFRNLNVPEPTLPSQSKQAAIPIRQHPPRPSVREELEQLQKQAQQEEASRHTVPTPAPAPVPSVTSKTSLKNPATAIQAQGMGPGSNPYLQLVQRQISRAWIPPQVDPTAQSFQVVVKFRLLRNGSVRDVVVEQTSGNDYYDMAGRRAVLSAQLPEFPHGMSDAYLDAHFSFMVGDQAG